MARKCPNTNGNKQRFRDTFVIFHSTEDQCWIAHSLRTDQFGTGECVVDALVDGMKAVDQVVALAKKKPDIQVLSDAPEQIQQIAKKAQPLPKEIYEIAHKKLYGDWPEYVRIQFDVEPSISFKRIVEEAVA